MLLETDFAHLKDTLSKNAEARFYIVMQHHPKYIRINQIQECDSLSPSDELLRQYKLGSVTWDEFKKKYFNQLKNPVCQELLKIIAQESEVHDVYLVSNCDSGDYCYRVLLKDVVDHFKWSELRLEYCSGGSVAKNFFSYFETIIGTFMYYFLGNENDKLSELWMFSLIL